MRFFYLRKKSILFETYHNFDIILIGDIIMQNIRPSAELRNKYNEVSNLCKESREPVFITVNGRGDTVLLGIEQYYQMQSELELLKLLAESEDDVRNGRVSPIENTFSDIRKKLSL